MSQYTQLVRALLAENDSNTGLDQSNAQTNNVVPSTTDIRIIAVFVILCAGLIGGLVPLVVGCFRNPSHPATLLLRSLAAGVILSLALIHVIPDGAANLEGLYSGPLAASMVVLGVLTMVVVENMSRHFLSGMHTTLHSHDHGQHDHDDVSAPVLGTDAARGPTAHAHGHDKSSGGHVAAHTHVHAHVGDVESGGATSSGGADDVASCASVSKVELHCHDHAHDHDLAHDHDDSGSNDGSPTAMNTPVCAVTGAVINAYTHGQACTSDHRHTCIAVNNAANFAANVESTLTSHQIVAYMFELACIIHSVLIGITLGVTVDDRHQAVALVVALVFHQCLEGIGLGTMLVKASFGMTKSVVMVITFSLMTPMGVGIGMAIASGYNPDSRAALTVQGVLSSFSGGLLLYISLVQMIAEDFTKTETSVRGGMLVRVGSYFMLALGATCMVLIAVFGEGDAHGH